MDTNDRTILRRLIVALILIVILGAVIWIFFIRNADKKPANQKDTNTAQQSGSANPDTPPPVTNNPQTQQGDGTPQPSAPTTSTLQGQQQPTTLANTGPGNLVAVFAGASTIGGVAHHLIQRKLRRTRFEL